MAARFRSASGWGATCASRLAAPSRMHPGRAGAPSPTPRQPSLPESPKGHLQKLVFLSAAFRHKPRFPGNPLKRRICCRKTWGHGPPSTAALEFSAGLSWRAGAWVGGRCMGWRIGVGDGGFSGEAGIRKNVDIQGRRAARPLGHSAMMATFYSLCPIQRGTCAARSLLNEASEPRI